ncbi:hypothetical protein TNCT_400141 [Trichonephila clavata]|uniref:Uncharacterized protein n=1 Tax=Trichonephila clavata TaxID=2740835 RepID=A0A8X6GG38_TRICU|nr:hypothetical protein TNCT_400141 [Trichonephila clavata]
MSKEALVVLNRKRGSVKAQLTRIKDFINNPDEKDKIKLESKMDTLKGLRIKLSDIRNEYYEVVLKDSDLEPLELEILDLEDDCEDIQESGRKLQDQLVSLLRGAGMELHKWSASNPLLLPDSMCQDKDLSYSSSTETKTLGLLWKPHPASFAFKISPMTSNCTSL